MQNTSIHLPKIITGAALVLSAGFLLSLLAQSEVFLQNPGTFSWAITLDLVLTLPLIWLISIRRQAIPRVTVYTLALVGLAFAFVILPQGHQHPAEWLVTWVLPFAEMAVALYLLWNVRRIISAYRQQTAGDFPQKLRKALQVNSLSPKLAALVAGEVAIPYYLFFAGSAKQKKGWTYHRSNSLAMLSGVIVLLLAVETLALHVLIAMWSEPLAWILSLSNVYVLALLVANFRASLHRKIELDDEGIHLYNGLFAEGFVPWAKVEGAQTTRFRKEGEEQSLNVGFLGYNNVQIDLKEDAEMHLFMGRNRNYRRLYLQVDEREGFVDAINAKIRRL